MTKLNAFLSEETGAVTTDWVVLAAALIGLCFSAVGVLSGGIEDLSFEIAEDLASIDPTAPPF